LEENFEYTKEVIRNRKLKKEQTVQWHVKKQKTVQLPKEKG